nr:YitT family protein [Actinomycetales bacterium]
MTSLPGMPGRAGAPRPDVGNLLRRALVLVVGLFLVALGIALITRADLGTSAISAPPYVLSLWGSWTFGQYTFAMLVVLVAFQMVLLRRRYQPIQVLQLAAGLVFSAFIDLAMWITPLLTPDIYVMQLVQLALGIVVLGIGVACQVVPRLTYLPGDGTVVALVLATGVRFSRMKILFDSLLVAIAIALSFVFWGELRGVREGTVAAAVLVGAVVGWVMPGVKRLAGRVGALPPAG